MLITPIMPKIDPNWKPDPNDKSLENGLAKDFDGDITKMYRPFSNATPDAEIIFRVVKQRKTPNMNVMFVDLNFQSLFPSIAFQYTKIGAQLKYQKRIAFIKRQLIKKGKFGKTRKGGI